MGLDAGLGEIRDAHAGAAHLLGRVLKGIEGGDDPRAGGGLVALLVEQAGGISVNGSVRTMDIEPKALHERTPLVMGSADEVEHVLRHVRG